MGQQLQFTEEAERLNTFINDIQAINDMVAQANKLLVGGNNIRKFEDFDALKDALDRVMNEAPIVLKNSKVIVDNADTILGEANRINARAKEIQAEAQEKADQKLAEVEQSCSDAITAAKEEADEKANQIINDAKAQAACLVEENVITIQAKQAAEALIKKAEAEADEYSHNVHAEADAYNTNIRDQLNKIVREYLSKLDDEYAALEKRTQEQLQVTIKDHEEFIARFRGNNN